MHSHTHLHVHTLEVQRRTMNITSELQKKIANKKQRKVKKQTTIKMTRKQNFIHYIMKLHIHRMNREQIIEFN